MVKFSDLKLSFDKELEKEFETYLIEHERVELRFAAFLLISINSVFIVIDYFRVEHFIRALIFRLIFITIYSSVLFIPFSRIRGNPRLAFLVTAHVATLLFIFYMDYATDVPQSFLSNTIIGFAFCSFTITALRFRYALILNLTAVFLYILHIKLYCSTSFHPTQTPAIISTLILSIVVGYLLERSKRLNFIQKQKITEYSRELEKTNDQKTVILSILSHDLASPLNSLAGLIEARNSNLISHEEWDVFMEKLKLTLGNTNTLLLNLVRWSRTQLNGFFPSYKKVLLKDILNESIKSLGPSILGKNITLNKKTDDRLEIWTDPDMLELVLRNVISNAVKFSFPNAGVDIVVNSMGGQLEIIIRDYGTGMHEEQKKLLFLDLSKSQPGTSNEKGTGIGLVLTKSFISILNGGINVESEPGKGTTVRIILPQTK